MKKGYLCLDSATTAHQVVFTFFSDVTVQETYHIENGATVLSLLDTFFLNKNIARTDVSGIAVVVGVGSFTTVRLAVTLANTLAFTWGVPCIDVLPDEINDVVARCASTPIGHYALPRYSHNARLGGV